MKYKLSARERLNAVFSEMDETRDAVNEFINHSYTAHQKSYAHATGALSVILEDAINLLPKAKRAEFRERLYRLAAEQKRDVEMQSLRDAKERSYNPEEQFETCNFCEE